ncbi:helix-turn-helix domain-containing protein [Micromonospora chersina]|uniref:helix-turn-helix domain-containing protein n=1 Tax=Micromonospora chersina TaxID=47854 RepID=UPI00371199FE
MNGAGPTTSDGFFVGDRGGRRRPSDDGAPTLSLGLRDLRLRSGLSLRQLSARSGYSIAALSMVENGRRHPSWTLVEAFTQVCGDDPAIWRPRWEGDGAGPGGSHPDPPLPPEPVVDGADPERCGCVPDKRTTHARKLIWTSHVPAGYGNVHLGVVELRYSPRRSAVWGRFTGTAALDNVENARSIDVAVSVHRVDDGAEQIFRCRYCFDVHWSDILVAGGSTTYARTVLYRDGLEIGRAETNHLLLR